LTLPFLKARFSQDGARCEVKTNGIDLKLVGNAHPTVYQGLRRFHNADWSVPLELKRIESIMRQLKIPLIMFVCCLLVSCENNPPNPTDTSSVSSQDTRSAQPSSPRTSPGESPTVDTPKSTQSVQTQRISAKGIGVAQVGMRLGELKELLADQAEFQVKSPFMVDFDAIAIVQEGKPQYYILYPAGIPMSDDDIIEALVTDNPNYQTAEGVGPGTPLKQAEEVYGEATLTYSTVNESREYVKFAQHPSPDMTFRLGAANDDSLTGVYPSPQKEFNQTKEYKDTATIRFVEVYCGKDCPVQPLPN